MSITEKVDSIANRIQACIKGQKFEIQLTEVPVNVSVHVFWEEDLQATVLYEIDFDPQRMCASEERLLEFLVASYDLEVCPIFDDEHINNLPSFKETADKIDAFRNEVAAILTELDDLSEQFPELFASLKPIIAPFIKSDEDSNLPEPEGA